jgi:rhamnosyltransferase subunit B
MGSGGDLNPFLAVGSALRKMGHEVALLTNPTYAGACMAAGVEPLALGEAVTLREVIERYPEITHSLRGPMTVIRRIMAPMVPEIVRTTSAAIDTWKPDGVLTHPLCMGVTWECDRRGLACAVAALAPTMWFNPRDQLVMPSFRSHRPSPLAVRFDLFFGRLMMAAMLDGPLNKVRRSMGLEAGRGVFLGDCRAGIVNLGLWSPTFRGPVEGDPQRGVICGFPWYDRDSQREAPAADIEAFLDEGPPPIVFTLGTAVVHTAGGFYRAAAEACTMLNRRGLLLVGEPDYAPALGSRRDVRAFTYAPYSTLFPRAAAVVHHGGIGTTAQGLRAGRPTLVVPAAHDQFDNAARVKRLGASQTLNHARVNGRRLAGALEEVLGSSAMADAANRLSAAIRSDDGGRVGAEHLVRAFSGGRG